MGSVGALGFWIFVAALVVGSMWSDARKKAEKHETLRRIVEKTGTIDEVRLKVLFSDEASEGKPGYAYRGLRIAGTIVLFVAAGIATFLFIGAVLERLFAPLGMFGNVNSLILGSAVSAGIAVIGLGLFYSSRFAERPPGSRNEPPAR